MNVVILVLTTLIDVSCVVELDKKKICHPHPLVSLISKPIICECKACGRDDMRGIFFLCTTCPDFFAIHGHCAFLPKSVLIQHASRGTVHHTHPLTLSYSFPMAGNGYAFGCVRICEGHVECALLLPPTIKHAYDKHPMQLSYLPIGNHNIVKFVRSIGAFCLCYFDKLFTETYSYYQKHIYLLVFKCEVWEHS
ncbi:hypothetical protein Hanom_Chr10g00932201 [Helianthus anomalus]